MVEVTASLSEEELEELRRRAHARGVDPNHYLRQALVNEQFLEDKVGDGAEVLLRDKNGAMERVNLTSA